jgi:hypothetical protein
LESTIPALLDTATNQGIELTPQEQAAGMLQDVFSNDFDNVEEESNALIEARIVADRAGITYDLDMVRDRLTVLSAEIRGAAAEQAAGGRGDEPADTSEPSSNASFYLNCFATLALVSGVAAIIAAVIMTLGTPIIVAGLVSATVGAIGFFINYRNTEASTANNPLDEAPAPEYPL